MILYASGTRWLALQPTASHRIEQHPVLRTPTTVVWQPSNCTVGVASFEGDERHAAVLIERRLRNEGTIEADTKFFVHHVERAGKTYQALYSSSSLDEWHRMQGWVGAQREHCAWTSLCALAWSRVDMKSAVVLRVDNAFIFMGRAGSRIVQANTLAFGADEDSLAYTARTLGERVRAELAQSTTGPSGLPSAVEWISAHETCSAAVYAATTHAFEASSSLQVMSMDTVLTSDPIDVQEPTGETARSALPRLSVRLPTRLLLNTPRERALLLAERHIAVTLGAAIVTACVFFGIAAQKALEARRIASATRALEQRIAEVDRQEPAPVDQAADAAYREQLAFVDTVSRLQGGLDVVEILLALKSAASADLGILSVRAEELPPERETQARGVLVDGAFQDGRNDQDSATLSSFVRTLASLGYTAEPIETRAAAAASAVSSQLFTYRLTRKEMRSYEGRTP